VQAKPVAVVVTKSRLFIVIKLEEGLLDKGQKGGAEQAKNKPK
jgi:hypothetical protein